MIQVRDAYARHVRPALWDTLRAIRLDVEYERARGDWLYYRNADGGMVEVLDLLGGFGASLLGHNHPELVARAREVLASERPFHAQASVRGPAGELAKRLSAAVGRLTGRSYVVTFGNSGAEGVEAAMKHAELERVRRLRAVADGLRRRVRRARQGLCHGTVRIPPDFFDRAAQLLGSPADDVGDVLACVLVPRAGRVPARPRMPRG